MEMDKRKKVVAIIQARMSSSRLPNKVLMKLSGKPIVWHIIERLRRSKNVNEIIVATTINKEDDKLVEYLESLNVKYFRGLEDDVLNRFILAAEKFDADIVVRICCDSPLIDPEEIDKMISVIYKDNSDYVLVKQGVKCIHEGMEVVSLEALRKQLDFSQEGYVKEHVTIYIRENPEKFKISYFEPTLRFQRDGFRLSIDNSADFKFMQEIYKQFYLDERNIVGLREVIDFLDKYPSIKMINAHVKQKEPSGQYNNILIKTEAGDKIGLNHIERMLVLSNFIVEHLNHCVIFGINKNDICKKIVNEDNIAFKCDFVETNEDIIQFSNKMAIDILIVDVKDINLYDFLEIKNKTRIRKIISVGGLIKQGGVDSCFVPPLNLNQFKGELA